MNFLQELSQKTDKVIGFEIATGVKCKRARWSSAKGKMDISAKKETKLHIKYWPESERPREMLLEKGPSVLSDAALLAVLLRTGRQGQDAVALAREIIGKFGGLNGLVSATSEDLLRVKGIGKAKVAQILAAMEMVKRQLRQPLETTNVVENPDQLFAYLRASTNGLDREEFRILHLNRSRQLMADEVLFYGTVDESAVYSREVVKAALARKASAIILVHNHPAGPAKPSNEDIALTVALVKACATVDMPVLDHVIIGGNECVSLRQHQPELFNQETTTP